MVRITGMEINIRCVLKLELNFFFTCAIISNVELLILCFRRTVPHVLRTFTPIVTYRERYVFAQCPMHVPRG